MKKITISIFLILFAGYFFTACAKKKSKFKTLNYLTGISGSKTVAGIHNREPNSSPSKWTELTTDGTALNNKWKERIDEVAGYLRFLSDKGVEVLWRPLHEMNQPAFWWGGRPGPDGTLKLYRMLHDYMTNEKKLTNLVWVWDIQDFDTLSDDAKSYNPGDKYWDIAALDVYNDKSGFSQEKYNIMLSVSHGKPVAIGECQKLPKAEEILKQPRWTFFMCWAELEFEKNSMEQIKAIHNAPNIITLDKMPGWK